MSSSQNLRSNKGKAQVVKDDENYRPEEEGLCFSSEEEEKGNDNDKDEGYLGGTSSVCYLFIVFNMLFSVTV